MPPKAFNPPRPTTAPKTSTTAKGKLKSRPTSKPVKRPATGAPSGPGRPRKKAPPPLTSVSSSSEEDSENSEEEQDQPSEEVDEDDSATASSSPSSSGEEEPTTRPRVRANDNVRHASPPRSGNAATEDDYEPPAIPEKLLTTILHSHFQHPDTRVNREARDLLGRYVETFVREAVARAVVERRGSGGDWLEVEDLEKLAPQLILDF